MHRTPRWQAEFQTLANRPGLSPDLAGDLDLNGFVFVPGPIPQSNMPQFAAAYDQAMQGADPADLHVGSTTTRLHDFVNHGEVFDSVYLHQPLLSACCQTIGEPFKLSSFLGRTLRPNMPSQTLHMDYPPDGNGWPMVGFILMIDDFKKENGATCFVPGSHRSTPTETSPIPVCGPAGSMIIYNGSVFHGHGTNQTDRPRRSLQGAYIRRSAQRGHDPGPRMTAQTRNRLSPLATYLLALEELDPKP